MVWQFGKMAHAFNSRLSSFKEAPFGLLGQDLRNDQGLRQQGLIIIWIGVTA
jgi:hypothetical protein